MNSKIPLVAALVLLTTSLWPQFVTRVAVVDMNKVYQEFFRESEAVRRLEQMRANIQNEVNRMNTEINQLEQQLLSARAANDQRTVLSLEENIQRKRDYLREFIRVRQTQLNSERDALTRSPSFLNQIQEAIRFVAESRGFTIVFRTDDSNLLYFNIESDITNFVIERLRGGR